MLWSRIEVQSAAMEVDGGLVACGCDSHGAFVLWPAQEPWRHPLVPRQRGYSRQQFYEIRRNYQTDGAEGLIDRLLGPEVPIRTGSAPRWRKRSWPTAWTPPPRAACGWPRSWPLKGG